MRIQFKRQTDLVLRRKNRIFVELELAIRKKDMKNDQFTECYLHCPANSTWNYRAETEATNTSPGVFAARIFSINSSSPLARSFGNAWITVAANLAALTNPMIQLRESEYIFECIQKVTYHGAFYNA
jgi:hypothetical protein